MSSAPGRLWPPPVPREHGAWAMLYSPLVLGVLAVRPSALGPAVLLALAITAAYLGQHAASLLLRRRARPGTAIWLVAYTTFAVAPAGYLVLGERHGILLWLAAPAAALLLWQAWRRQRTGRHLERSYGAELATIGVLSLSAPAAVFTAGGAAALAGLCWLACVAYFGGSVLYVKMRVRGASAGSGDSRHRLRLGWPTGLYHLALAGGPLALASHWPGVAVMGAVAMAPAAVRAGAGWWAVGRAPLSIGRVGLVELACAVWFTLVAGMALHGLAPALLRG